MIKIIFICLLAISSISANDFHKKEKLVLSGPMASVSHPLFYMIETGALNDVANKIEFRLWKNPDELRAFTIRGNVDFVAVPTNVAANLYNKGINLKLLNVSVWSILSILTRDKDKKTLLDFKGCEIAMPFRADMPDIIFEEIAKAQGLNPKKDFKLRYLSSPIDAMQMLILRRVDHALLAEPATSIALRKTGSYPLKLVAPTLYRSTILANEWGKTFKVESKIPVAGMAVVGDMTNNTYIIKRFNEEYKKAMKWYKQNPKEAGILSAKYIKMLDAKGVEDSISYVKLDIEDAKESKDKLEFLFKTLKNNNPKSIGGKLPDAKFYY
jgi:NitT/TauT family transport system substrate-binding protein